MNKADLVTRMAEKAEMTKKDAEKALDSLMEAVMEALEKGDKVQLVGFGTFEVKERAERKGVNPQTKEEMIIPATKTVVFRPGGPLKEAVAGTKTAG